ncbi:ATP-grasp fold amidoligase family protein [Subtercola sp. Z020]|uniref:ATP-grasp fold amidoligase family protein n=1 Tax=Subtercola sp. Z020 TaxID=2080582 RepID=UPI001E3BAEE4|nr:ATP-grasp fold amidoligase family protein [Subtercola sp. Z020]
MPPIFTPEKPIRRRERSRLVRAWRLFRTRRPVTFTEKVQYKMLRDRRPLLVTFADKAAVREYIADRVGEAYLPDAIGVFDEADALRGLSVGEGLVIKPTHGSGAVVVVSPEAAPEARLVRPDWGWIYQHVLPSAADPDLLARTAGSWLRKLYGRGPNSEWAYSRIQPRIIVEELLSSPEGAIPDDLKFFVFHGRCEYVQVDSGRFGERTQDFYSRDWEHLELSGGLPWATPGRPRPETLDEMIALAERLAEETDFLRVDLYLLPGRIVVGELTSYPAGGHSPFEPPSFNERFGSHWTVPNRYR